MEIRQYLETDEQAVVALWKEVFPDAPPHNDPKTDIARKLHVQRELFFVAVRDGAVIGTVMAGFDGHRGWVYYLAVSPPHRRQGVGAALMKRVEQELAAVGCPKLNIMVRVSNQQMTAFYERLGFRLEEIITMGKLLTIERDVE